MASLCTLVSWHTRWPLFLAHTQLHSSIWTTMLHGMQTERKGYGTTQGNNASNTSPCSISLPSSVLKSPQGNKTIILRMGPGQSNPRRLAPKSCRASTGLPCGYAPKITQNRDLDPNVYVSAHCRRGLREGTPELVKIKQPNSISLLLV